MIACVACQSADAAFSCGQCHLAHYCGAECQRAAWPAHGADCARFLKTKPVSPAHYGAAEHTKALSDMQEIVALPAFEAAHTALRDLVEALARDEAPAAIERLRARGAKIPLLECPHLWHILQKMSTSVHSMPKSELTQYIERALERHLPPRPRHRLATLLRRLDAAVRTLESEAARALHIEMPRSGAVVGRVVRALMYPPASAAPRYEAWLVYGSSLLELFEALEALENAVHSVTLAVNDARCGK